MHSKKIVSTLSLADWKLANLSDPKAGMLSKNVANCCRRVSHSSSLTLSALTSNLRTFAEQASLFEAILTGFRDMTNAKQGNKTLDTFPTSSPRAE